MLWFEPSGIGQRELQSGRPQEKALQGRYDMCVIACKELDLISYSYYSLLYILGMTVNYYFHVLLSYILHVLLL